MIFNIPVGGKLSAVVSVYGAADETVTVTAENGAIYTATTDDTGYGGELKLPRGVYTIAGSVSGFSKSATVDKNTTRINAWMDNAVIYFWHGATPCGAWTGEGFTGTNDTTDESVWSTENGKLYVKSRTRYSDSLIGTSQTVDLTGIDKIHFAVEECSHPSATYFWVSETKAYKEAAVEVNASGTGSQTVVLDVTGRTGNHYLAFHTHVSATPQNRTCTVNRVWGTVDPAGTIRSIEKSIAINNTYRYCNGISAGFVRVGSLGGDLQGINYVGEGTKDYNSMMIPVPAFSYDGIFASLKLALHLWTSPGDNHVFRWAVTTSRENEALYRGYGDVTDENQLATGSFAPPKSDSYQWYTIPLDGCTVSSGTPLFLYLWRDNNIYGNIHVNQSAVVTLNYAKA